MQYRIIVKNLAGTTLGEFEKFKGLNFGKKLNNADTASFTVPVNDPKIASLIALRLFTVWIYRDNLLLWSGEQVSREGVLDDKGDNWVTILCYDWFESLLRRYTKATRNFWNVDAGQIAWTMIDETQQESDFGITLGTIETTQNRDRQYENQNIGEAIINLSNVINGFDFEINNFKVFNVKSMIGVDRTGLVLEYGYNIKNCTITEDFKIPVNRAIILGDSGNIDEALRIERDDTTSQVAYKLRENQYSETSVTDINTLEAKGDSYLRKYGSALVKLSIDLVRGTHPNITEFSLGDVLTLKIKTGLYNIEEQHRVYQWRITYEPDNTEKLDLVLGKFISI